MASIRRRAEILGAARRQLGRREAAELAVGDVAAEAGVSPATVYNLVGPRDRLLAALVDEIVDDVERRLAKDPPPSGLDGCLAVLDAGCDAVLADPAANRRILGALGGLDPGAWMGVGLAGVLGRWADATAGAGTLSGRRPPSTVVDLLVFGYRGVLISWVFGHVADEHLRPTVARQALHVLSDAVPDAARADVLDRTERLDRQLNTPRRATA